MAKKTKISVNFRIKKIELLDHSLSFSSIPTGIKKPDLFYFTTTVSIGFDLNNKYLVVEIFSKFGYDEVKETQLGFIKTLTTFLIQDLENFTIKNDPGILVQLPDVLMANFIGLAISSTRGMLAFLTKGTPLESAILPIQNPLSFARKLGLKKK